LEQQDKTLVVMIQTVDREGGTDLITFCLEYIFDTTDRADKKQFIQNLVKMVQPKTGAKVMTIAESLREEGREEMKEKMMTMAERLRVEVRAEAKKEVMTIAESLREEGREEKAQEIVEIAKRMLAAGTDVAFVAKMTKLPRKEIEKLKNIKK
jgi:predicted transposase/invertase (TIGR01784 family)